MPDSRPAFRYPWGDFPEVARNGDLGELKAQPEYTAAKSGDDLAALDMATRLVRPEFVEAIARLGKEHPMPVLLPVLAVESAGKNRIPLALAEVLGDRLGWPVETSVTQMSRSFKTDSGADHRLTVRTVFDGTVNQEAGYILVDDTLTMGGTIADLRGFVLSRGGRVLGSGVGVAHPGAVHLPVRDKMIHSIEAKHGAEAVQAFAQEQWGYGIECLTQGEAGHVRSAVSLDALRSRFAAARDASQQRLDEAGIAASAHGIDRQQSAKEVTQPEHPPASARDAAQSPQIDDDTPILIGGSSGLSVLHKDSRKEPRQSTDNSPHSRPEFLKGRERLVDYLKGRELLLVRDSPYHTQAPETDAPFSVRPRADKDRLYAGDAAIKSPSKEGTLLEQDGPILSSLPNSFDPGTKVDEDRLANPTGIVKGNGFGTTLGYAIKTAMITRERYYRNEIPLLQRDAPITRSSERTPFGAGPEADGISLEKARRLVKATGQHAHTEEQKIMAQEHTKLFSYGPLDVVQDPSTQELHVFDADMGGSATLTPDDPLHKTVLHTIEKNQYSKGFVANQINAMIEKEDRWHAPELDTDALSFGPSQKEVAIDGVAKSKGPSAGMEVSDIDLNSPEGQAILKEMQAAGIRLIDPAEYDPATPEVPPVAKQAAQTLSKVQPALPVGDAAVSLHTQNRLLDPAEYVPARYENGVPEAGQAAASEIAREARTLSKGVTLTPEEKKQMQNENLQNAKAFLGNEPSIHFDNVKFAKNVPEEERSLANDVRVVIVAKALSGGTVLNRDVDSIGKDPDDWVLDNQYAAVVRVGHTDPDTGEKAYVTTKSLFTGTADEMAKFSSELRRNGIPSDAYEVTRGNIQEAMTNLRDNQKETVSQENPIPIDAEKEPSYPSLEDPEKRDPSKLPDKEVQEALQNWPGSQEQKNEQKALENDAAPKPKFDRIRPPTILLDNGKGKPHVLDHGDKITVTNRAMMGVGMGVKDKRRKAVDVALLAAADRFGQPVHFQGNEKFMAETIAVAIQRGVKLEPGNDAAKRMYEQALEKMEVNQLGPAKAAPYRAPAKSKEASKDKGVGL